jgi:glycosyltransferase involved in cell wall biosynthesis
MKNISVLMIGRSTLDSSPGGDSIQIYSTAKYLRILGVNVDVKLANEKVNYDDYDLIHFFNIIRPDDILAHISKNDLPFVVSTIFVDYSEYEKLNRRGLLGIAAKIFTGDQLEYIKTVARYIVNGDKIKSLHYLIKGQRASINYVSRRAKLLLPNSHSEFKRFAKLYETSKFYRKVPNAIDISTFDENVAPNEEFRNHVLCVGRIEGLKNQLNLLVALMDTEYNVTLIGKSSPNHKAYYEKCLELVSRNPRYRLIDHIDHNELSSIYKAAKVHVLASWFETTGLSSLEAAVMGCNLVVTRKGDTEEYFGDMAEYCDPNDTASIRRAVDVAYHKPFNPSLKLLLKSNFTWMNAAEETFKGYKFVLSEEVGRIPDDLK